MERSRQGRRSKKLIESDHELLALCHLADRRGCSIDALLDSMSSPELTLWLGYYWKEGFPEYRADKRAAITSYCIAGDRNASVEQFMPNYNPRSNNEETKQEFIRRAKVAGKYHSKSQSAN